MQELKSRTNLNNDEDSGENRLELTIVPQPQLKRFLGIEIRKYKLC